MGCCHNLNCFLIRHRFAISFLIFLIYSSSHFRLFNGVQGRKLAQTSNSMPSMEEKMVLRAQIGSRPPRCRGRCNTCTNCEAIQVPTNPQIKKGDKNKSSELSAEGYARSDDTSNYKPMSWKCKCGNLIFNP